MKKILTIFISFLLLAHQNNFAQFNKQIDSLCIICDKSTSDSEKVVALGKLAEYYFTFKLNKKADSVLHEQLLIAEVSGNSNLILQTLFGDAIVNIGKFAGNESFEKTLQFVRNGIDYARANNNYDYMVLGYLRLADLQREKGYLEKSLSNCNLAMSFLQNVRQDSVKCLAYIGIGNTYLARGEAVLACANYNNAFDIAVKKNFYTLQSKVYHLLAEMYRQLDDASLAKNELGKSLALNRERNDLKGIMLDYFDLARLTDEKFFILKSIELAQTLKDFRQLLNSKRLLLVYYYVTEKDRDKAFSFLKSEPELAESYKNEGDENYLITIGNIYFFSGNSDSALIYYMLADSLMQPSTDKNLVRINYAKIAECLALQGRNHQSLEYYQKAFELSLGMNNISTMALYTNKMSKLYEADKDFENAYRYSKQSLLYKDSLKELSKQNDIALLGVDRENIKHQQELYELRQRDAQKRIMGYAAITAIIVVLFFVMLMVGSYSVSRRLIKLMGYFFFISLFEFISLIIDFQFVSPYSHGQPLKSWLIKIAVIIVLVPIQQFLEHRVISFLLSKKLIKARSEFSFRKWWDRLSTRFNKTEEPYSDQTLI